MSITKTPLPFPAPARTPVIGFLPSPAIYHQVAVGGENRAKQNWRECLVLSFLAGAYIAFGAALLFTVGGQMPAIGKSDPGLRNILNGIFGLPYGLSMVIILGAELCTGNFMFLITARIEGRCNWWHVWSRLFINWWGNFLGSLFMVMLIRYSEIWTGREAEKTIMAVSLAKTKLTWTEAVVRGILCNWLVCIAISFANAAQDISGKFFGVFVPISAFIAMGFEHCVANQFIIPMGMTYSNGADIGRMFWYNLIPATIGNFIGGVFCLTVPYSLCYGSLWAHIENFTGIKWTHLDPGYPGSTYYPFDDEYKWSTEDCAPVAVSAAASVEAPVDKSSPPSSSSVAQLAHGLPYMAHPYGPPNPAAVYMTGVNAPRY